MSRSDPRDKGVEGRPAALVATGTTRPPRRVGRWALDPALAAFARTARRLRRHGVRLALCQLRAQPRQLIAEHRFHRIVEVITGPLQAVGGGLGLELVQGGCVAADGLGAEPVGVHRIDVRNVRLFALPPT